MMKKESVLEQIHHRLIVSCQARKGWAMHGSEIMAAFAAAAKEGGAGGLRANGAEDIRAIRQRVPDLPMIGINKQWRDEYEVYITPSYESAVEILETGVEVIALDATPRTRPGGVSFGEIAAQIRAHYPEVLIMAEISTLEEAKAAAQLDIDLISTTLSGYTPESSEVKEVNLPLIAQIHEMTSIPIVAEGKIQTVEEAVAAFRAGAHSVVVGTSITRPEIITSRYVAGIDQYFAAQQG